MKIQPISPSEVVEAKIDILPDEVIKSFNELIAERWNGNRSMIIQKEVAERIMDKLSIHPKDRQIIFDRGYLDVEPIFEKVGWKVVYNKPSFDENYDPYFTFSKS